MYVLMLCILTYIIRLLCSILEYQVLDIYVDIRCQIVEIRYLYILKSVCEFVYIYICIYVYSVCLCIAYDPVWFCACVCIHIYICICI